MKVMLICIRHRPCRTAFMKMDALAPEARLNLAIGKRRSARAWRSGSTAAVGSDPAHKTPHAAAQLVSG